MKLLEADDISDEDTAENLIENDRDEQDMVKDGEALTEYVYEIDETIETDDVVLYNCDACGIDFGSIEEHLERYHSNQDVVVDIEDAVDLRGNEIIESSAQVAENEQYGCNKCDKTFNTLLLLSMHIRSTHQNRPTPGKSSTAMAERGTNPRKLVKDKASKVKPEGNEGENMCSICNTTFVSAKSYK